MPRISAPSTGGPATVLPYSLAALHEALGISVDVPSAGSGLSSTAPAAGTLYTTRVPITVAGTIGNVLLEVVTAGTGATALANCFVGVWADATSGALRGVSVDRSVDWATAAVKKVPVTVQGGQSLDVAVGDVVVVGFYVGTQSTTNVQMLRGASTTARANWGNATTFRFGLNAGGFAGTPPATLPALSNGGVAWAAGVTV